ncbi:MAG TPA: response regulator transcription factor [Clostridia bacterium]|nr:response regulator transcription factor [Clostridia bacterium]
MEKILLIEDDSALVAGLRYSIEKEGYDITTAGSVREGCEKFFSGNFSLVVLDIGLPDGTGFDVCRTIREKSMIPILFLTACDEEVNVVMGLDMGADEYITKPFRLRELLSRIRALLRRSGTARAADILESGCFRLNTSDCRLFKGKTEITLTPAEYRLVFFLMKNEGRTITRDQLLEKLWDAGGDYVDANTLTVYIRRLREKIEDDPSLPLYISTVRGLGYRWEAAPAQSDS